MDTDKVFLPFVSDDLVEDLLNKVTKTMNDMRNETLKVRAPSLLKVVRECLTQLEEAAGDNIDLWEQWMTDEDDGNLYPNIDLEWYEKNITALKVQTAIQFSIYLLKDAEQPWNAHDSAVFVSSRLIQLCYKLCEWVGIDTVLFTGGDVLVAVHLKALCLYIALRNERDKLEAEAALYGIPFEKPEKPKPEEKPQLSVDQWVDLPLEEKRKSEEWKDVFTEHATRIYGIAIGERKIMQGNGLGYEWTYGAPKPPSPSHLAFFLLLVYNFKDNIPWKKLQILFWPKFDKADKKGETHVGRVLRGRADQLRKRTDWYKHNINKLWDFKYTDFPPHFPDWAKEIYLYVSEIENRMAAEVAEKEATKKRKSKKNG